MGKGVYQRKEFKGECATCHKIFIKKTNSSKYCSRHCDYVAENLRANNRCVICNKLITRWSGKYCYLHWPRLSGSACGKWKGGTTINDKGYRKVMMKKHPRADKGGYVYEHILAWEKANNKELPEGWVVHHLNGIKLDNRPVNLVALSRRKHSMVLAAKAKRIQELEALLNGQKQLI